MRIPYFILFTLSCVTVAMAADIKPAPQIAGVTTEQSGFSSGSVVRSIFTTSVLEREPVDNVKTLNSDARKVFYFTELRDMSDQTATHRWEYDGEIMTEQKFNVKGPRWRVWSSKNFSPQWLGEWKVSVLNGAGEVISEDVLSYIENAPTVTPAASSPTQ